MAEYIDREAVINRIKEYASDVYGIDLDDPLQFAGNSKTENFCEGLYEATELVDDITAAEVAPVVHCRECEHSYEAVGGRFCTYGVCVDCEVPDDFYCGNGKRGETGEG